MRIEVYRSGLIPEQVFKDVLILLRDAFEERRSQGLNFKCGMFSIRDIENEFIGGGYLLLARDEKGKLVGTVSIIERHKAGLHYISHDNLAVSIGCQGKGVASMLFHEVLNIAKRENYDFITSFTATTADSSVKYHIKNGFVIYEKTFGKGYDSYSFIYPLKMFGFMHFKLISKLTYILLTNYKRIKKILGL